MSVRVIGIDCATDPKKVGLAWGDYSAMAPSKESVAIVGAQTGSASKGKPGWTAIVEAITQCASVSDPVLLALDAPLGWPESMRSGLKHHSAGSLVSIEADWMFQRQTDRFVKERIGKKPLDVGGDRIARTALATLKHLDEIRKSLNSAAPLAWDPTRMERAQVIEVYPAATLRAHGLADTGYKGSKEKHQDARKDLTDKLANNGHLNGISGDVRLQMEKTDHALDAVVCCLAAVDFLRGAAISPESTQMPRAKKEGWIWVMPKTGGP